MTDTAVYPYAGASPAAPTTTSRAAADHNDTTRITGKTQAMVLALADRAGLVGVTIRDVRNALDSHHHGTASSALSTLHKAGLLARLTDSRRGAAIYVLPQWIGGRNTEPQGRVWTAGALAERVPYDVLVEAVRLASGARDGYAAGMPE